MGFRSISAVLLSVWGLWFVEAACPNNCNHHGTCTAKNICECFSGWEGVDCSRRTCAQGIAWADQAMTLDNAHNLAVCSNAGLCNPETGLCECFEGFTGVACQRNVCPNNCSGRGSCLTLYELGRVLGRNGNTLGVEYNNWDAHSIQMCECDDGFYGADCSLRMCPRGDDPMTVGQDNLKFTIETTLTVSNPDPSDLAGGFSLYFQGKTVDFPLSSGADCSSYISNKGKFGQMSCQYSLVGNVIKYTLEVLSWPTFPLDNNLFMNTGNPTVDEFLCTDSSTNIASCTIQLDTNSPLPPREYVSCSNRGVCNSILGTCTCSQGFAGLNCGIPSFVSMKTADTLPGQVVSIATSGYTGDVLRLQTATDGTAHDFNFIAALSAGVPIFTVDSKGKATLSSIEVESMTVESMTIEETLTVKDVITTTLSSKKLVLDSAESVAFDLKATRSMADQDVPFINIQAVRSNPAIDTAILTVKHEDTSQHILDVTMGSDGSVTMNAPNGLTMNAPNGLEVIGELIARDGIATGDVIATGNVDVDGILTATFDSTTIPNAAQAKDNLERIDLTSDQKVDVAETLRNIVVALIPLLP